MKSIIRKIGLSAAALFLMLALSEISQAVESNLIIKLPLEIKQDIQSVMEIQQQTQKKVEGIESQITETVDSIHAADSQEEKVLLRKEYLGLRAEVLEQRAVMVQTVGDKLERIAKNIGRLEKVRQSSERVGLGKGISRDDPEARQAIADTFKGMHAIISQVKSLNADQGQNISYLEAQSNNLESVARKFFNGQNETNLEQEKEFILSVAAFVQSVKLLIREEHDYLLGQVYVVDAQDIVQSLGSLDEVFGGLQISTAFENYRALDSEVLQDDEIALNRAGGRSSHIDTSKWGNWDK